MEEHDTQPATSQGEVTRHEDDKDADNDYIGVLT